MGHCHIDKLRHEVRVSQEHHDCPGDCTIQSHRILGTFRPEHTIASRCGSRPPHLQDKAHLGRIQFQQKAIRVRHPQLKLIQERHHQTGGREKKSCVKGKPKSWNSRSYSNFRMLNMNVRCEVARGSHRFGQAVPWVNEIEQGQTVSDLAASNSVTGIATGDIET